MDSSAVAALQPAPARAGGLAWRIGRRWRIAAVAAVLAVVAAVMLTGGHRPAMGLTSRGAGVVSVAFSPDGKTLATGDDPGADQLTGTPARTYLWNVSWLP